MRLLLHRSELRLALVAVAALLVAQLGAMSHAYSHDSAFASAGSQLRGLGTHDACGDCLAYAPLLSAMGAPGELPFVEPAGRGTTAIAVAGSLIELLPTLAFRSRAPPYTP